MKSDKYSLERGIQEVELPPPLVTGLDPVILPQASNHPYVVCFHSGHFVGIHAQKQLSVLLEAEQG